MSVHDLDQIAPSRQIGFDYGQGTGDSARPWGTGDHIRRILGTLDETKLLDIVALRSTILDVEEASVWLAGDANIFGAGQPLKPVAGDIVAILTTDEGEQPRSAS